MSSADLEALLGFLRDDRGFDFTGYKRPSLERRVRHRMKEVGIDSLAEYADFLEVHPEEFAALFNTILVNVTGFFRDTEAWSFLEHEVVPALVASKGRNERIRVWSAGCATGEEAYTLAMVFDAALGSERFRDRVKVYGTDVDDDAIARARRGEYTTRELVGVPPERVGRYFEVVGSTRRVFRQDLRRCVVFGRHDLTSDTPISRVDLLVCRNTLIYLNSETQSEVISRFHFALAPHGYLFLGKSEALVRHNDLFSAVHLRYRVFQRLARRGLPLTPVRVPGGPQPPAAGRADRHWLTDDVDQPIEVAQAIVDGQGRLAAANPACRELFGLVAEDVGRPVEEIPLLRPAALRDAVRDALSEGRTTMLRNVDADGGSGQVRHFDVRVDPLGDGESRGPVSVVFLDVTRALRLEAEVRESKENLATAMEELQSANEELETTNEELQSTNEELETTNEELQSTNEELETMNEELQSATDQFDAMNREMRERTERLDEVNTFLASVLGSVLVSVVVLDPRFVVVSWNHAAEQLWGLWSSEVVGHSFFGLEVGLPVEQLRAPLLACLEGGSDRQELTVTATNRRGREIECRITVSPLTDPDGVRNGLVLLMEEAAAGRTG